MSERRWLRTSMRVLASTVTGVGVVALAAAGVAGGILWQAPESTPAPAPAVEVGAASLPLVCPPAPVVPTGDGGDIDYDEAFGTGGAEAELLSRLDRKSTRLNSSHVAISYAVFCLKKKKKTNRRDQYIITNFV